MDEKWRKTFLAWAETDDHQRVIEQAQKVIRQALSQSKPYLAFSGGKDSTVMLHLVLQFQPDIYVYHRYDRAGLEKYEKEVQDIAKHLGANIHTFDYWQDGRPFEGDISKELQDMGYNAAFIGIRAEESKWRARRIKNSIFLVEGFREWFPLAQWRFLDVWAYIVKHNIPYCSIYDERVPIVGYERARFSTFFDPDLDYIGVSCLDGLLNWRERYGDNRRIMLLRNTKRRADDPAEE